MTYPTYETMTREQWLKTIAHDHANPSRAIAFREIHRFLDRDGTLDLTEIGFCSGWDFRCMFKAWHDAGLIRYKGYDSCEQFALYAQAEWPGYSFEWGSGGNMHYCDISYARHVAMTMAPDLWPTILEKMLWKSRVACVVTYHYPPSTAHYERHQDGERDVWTNTYDRKEMKALYERAGYDVTIVPAGEEEVWVAKKRAEI